VWTALAVAEVLLAGTAVVLDLLVPTIVLLVLAAISLAARREGLATFGLSRGARVGHLVKPVFILTAAWTLIQLAVFLPVLNHVTGQKQDLSEFRDLEGNVALLIVLLVLSWTLAAFGEEIVYRGYIQTRIVDALGANSAAVIVAVGASSVLFGLAHTEQGIIGVTVTFLDAVFFSYLKLHYSGSLWAPVLAHGFNNTIGLTAYCLIGPVYGLW
jgi:hypothetical protein